MLSTIARENFGEARELRALFETQLKELYWAEQVMITKLPQIAETCTSGDLKLCVLNHIRETETHVVRLQQIFNVAGIEAESKTYDALQCLFKETEGLINNTKRGVVRDAGIIAALQKIKHYEIACYGTMNAYAKALREEEAVTLLEITLHEEKEVDQLLSAIAESHINIEAADKEL